MNKIVIISGPPLSGKSTLATLYGGEAGVPILDVDAIRLRILPDSKQTREDRTTAYRCMHYTAERLVLCGVKEVVLIATYRRWDVRRELTETAARCGADLFIVQCAVGQEIAADRFSARPSGHAAIDLTPESVREQAGDYPYFDGGLILDTTGEVPLVTLSTMMKYLRSGIPVREVNQWTDCAR